MDQFFRSRQSLFVLKAFFIFSLIFLTRIKNKTETLSSDSGNGGRPLKIIFYVNQVFIFTAPLLEDTHEWILRKKFFSSSLDFLFAFNKLFNFLQNNFIIIIFLRIQKTFLIPNGRFVFSWFLFLCFPKIIFWRKEEKMKRKKSVVKFIFFRLFFYVLNTK